VPFYRSGFRRHTSLRHNARGQRSVEDKVAFTDKGLEELEYNGAQFLLKETQFSVERIVFDGPQGKREIKNPAPSSSAADPKRHLCALTFEWGTASCQYHPAGNRLDMRVRIENRSKQTIIGASLILLQINIPGGRRLDLDATPAPHNPFGFVTSIHEKGTITLCNTELERPVGARLMIRCVDMDPLILRLTIPEESRPQHKVVDDRFFYMPGRPVTAGASDEYAVSLIFDITKEQTSELCRKGAAVIRKQQPFALKWPDRRPIGTIFIAPQAGPKPANPRGYACVKVGSEGIDITTAKGLADFREGLLEYADRCVAILKKMDAQGVIVWDLEGAEFPHPITYIGNPQALPLVSPEMNKYADEFFKKFHDAGFKTGVTIRPTEIYQPSPDKWWLEHRHVKDPVKLMSEKIAYCKKRWKSTLFYLDSNVYGGEDSGPGVPWLMPVEMLRKLCAEHPDVLIFPEWSNLYYYSVCAPYQSSQWFLYQLDPRVREIWPEAFGVFESIPTTEKIWEAQFGGVSRGDVLLFPTWFEPPQNMVCRALYTEVAYRKAGPPLKVARAEEATLLLLAKDEEACVRFWTAERLGKSKEADALPVLKAMLDDPDNLVRKNALVAMRAFGPQTDTKTAEKLVSLMEDRQAGPLLRLFAPETIGLFGKEAVKPLIALLKKGDMETVIYGIQALAATGTDDPEAIEVLISFLSSPRHDFQNAAVEALGRLRCAAAVEAIIPHLASPREEVSQTAVVALGEIGDKRAIEPLMKLFARVYQSNVVYNIWDKLDDALQKLTGEKFCGRKEWTKWWDEQKQKAAKN